LQAEAGGGGLLLTPAPAARDPRRSAPDPERGSPL